MLILRRALGRIQRRFANIAPHQLQIGDIGFPAELMPFLDEGDYRAMVTRTYDIALCDLLKRNLRPGDSVIDVGSNVGYIASVMASIVGPEGSVQGFEPLRECFERLEMLSALNPGRFAFHNSALGEREGNLPITVNLAGDSRNASLVPGSSTGAYSVPVCRLDEVISTPPRLIKIDVEGFEFAVLKGAERLLKHRPIVVAEIKPWTLAKLGATATQFDDYMRGFGYSSRLVDGGAKNVADLTEMDTLVFSPR